LLVALCAPFFGLLANAELPPVPVPAENPITEEKRVLGKILFWDEQLSSDNTVACGTCHRPAWGGADARAAVHPGIDAGTIDDVHGSPGIASLDANGQPTVHPVFGREPQVTGRSSPSFFGALWAPTVFWDGRALAEFRDPLTGAVAIAAGGALESQILATLESSTEMAKPGRQWDELTSTLEGVRPLALATDLPDDVAAAIVRHGTYEALFAAAFGDAVITPVRIAFAIATYERTLVSDQTPWDLYAAGDGSALSRTEMFGLQALEDFHCLKCHTPPLFTNNEFFNIGLRRSEFDRGREAITGDPEDAGEVRVPSLRNSGLRTRFMHTGEFASLAAAISFYRTGFALPDRDGIPGAGIYTFNMSPVHEADIRAFLATGLTDPRVRAEEFPFDRPTLRSERNTNDSTAQGPARTR
jgi:cytochrome c peroxidase